MRWQQGVGVAGVLLVVGVGPVEGRTGRIAGQGESPLTLAELEQRALANNPTLAQADARVVAATERASQAGRWANPSIGYTAEEVSTGETIRGGEHGFFVEQVFPTSGRLGASRRVFERQAEEAAVLRDAQRQRVLNDVRTYYYRALVAARRVAVRQDLAALAEEAVDVSRRLANVGAADQPDVLAVEIEAERAKLAVAEATHAERRLWRGMAQVIGDPTLEPQPLGGDPEPALPDLDFETVLSVLLTTSPEIQAVRARVRRAEAVVDRAGAEKNPDLIVRGGPRYNRELLEPGPRPVGWEFFADVGIRVPLWNRNQGGVAAAHAELDLATAEVRRVELVLRDRLAGIFETYATARAAVHAYRDEIVPRARDAHRLFLDRYREMAAAYPQVLIAQRTVFEVTDAYLDMLSAGWQAAVLLEGQLLESGLGASLGPGEPIVWPADDGA